MLFQLSEHSSPGESGHRLAPGWGQEGTSGGPGGRGSCSRDGRCGQGWDMAAGMGQGATGGMERQGWDVRAEVGQVSVYVMLWQEWDTMAGMGPRWQGWDLVSCLLWGVRDAMVLGRGGRGRGGHTWDGAAGTGQGLQLQHPSYPPILSWRCGCRGRVPALPGEWVPCTSVPTTAPSPPLSPPAQPPPPKHSHCSVIVVLPPCPVPVLIASLPSPGPGDGHKAPRGWGHENGVWGQAVTQGRRGAQVLITDPPVCSAVFPSQGHYTGGLCYRVLTTGSSTSGPHCRVFLRGPSLRGLIPQSPMWDPHQSVTVLGGSSLDPHSNIPIMAPSPHGVTGVPDVGVAGSLSPMPCGCSVLQRASGEGCLLKPKRTNPCAYTPPSLKGTVPKGQVLPRGLSGAAPGAG